MSLTTPPQSAKLYAERSGNPPFFWSGNALICLAENASICFAVAGLSLFARPQVSIGQGSAELYVERYSTAPVYSGAPVWWHRALFCAKFDEFVPRSQKGNLRVVGQPEAAEQFRVSFALRNGISENLLANTPPAYDNQYADTFPRILV